MMKVGLNVSFRPTSGVGERWPKTNPQWPKRLTVKFT